MARQYISATGQGLFLVELGEAEPMQSVPLEHSDGGEDVAVGSALWAVPDTAAVRPL